jgi:UDP-glucuronate 4-epimerase
LKRDFTYIDDITTGVIKCLSKTPNIDPDWNGKNPGAATSGIAPYQIYNIGSNKPVNLMDLISILEDELGRKSQKNYMPMQPGDAEASWASSEELIQTFNYSPNTSIETGIKNFVSWYADYFGISV